MFIMKNKIGKHFFWVKFMYKNFKAILFFSLLTTHMNTTCDDFNEVNAISDTSFNQVNTTSDTSNDNKKPEDAKPKRICKDRLKKRVNGLACALGGAIMYSITLNEFRALKQSEGLGLTSSNLLGLAHFAVNGPNRKNIHTAVVLLCATATANLFLAAYDRLFKL